MNSVAAYIRNFNFTTTPDRYQRRQTHEVHIGEVAVGGDNPIRIQSMTTTNTLDVQATVEQSIRMIEAGCEYVRITAPSKREAEALKDIRAELRKRGYTAPLIADIHFTPNAAEIAARYVEKVRVNPGNYVDKKKFQTIEYTDEQYQAELERIRERFSPLVKICKEEGTAMRIGTNHGSLSDRIMSRYGDTPVGMVESAMEFLRICEEHDYHEIVLSMKASNPVVMVQAYRLLVAKMDEEGMSYPLHLGVTEAGEGEDGRIKSAMGIGTLLEDGLGDTIRVSLTEEPELEAPVAIALAQRYEQRQEGQPVARIRSEKMDFNQTRDVYSPYESLRRKSLEIGNTGGDNVPRVVLDFSRIEHLNELCLRAADYHYDPNTDKWNMGELGADFIYLGNRKPPFMMPNGLKALVDYDAWQQLEEPERTFPLLQPQEYLQAQGLSSMNFLQLSARDVTDELVQKLRENEQTVLMLKSDHESSFQEMRSAIIDLTKLGVNNPVIIQRSYAGVSEEELQLFAATDAGGLLTDGFGDGIWLQLADRPQDVLHELKRLRLLNRTSFNILQASRTRISKTEYISCPSCGRTLFDLQETTAMIRKRTDHLKGVKIAVMGCIVNGPGEMADADYGYVGTGPGKITLYRQKEVVKRNIPSAKALDELEQLIREDGNWIEKTPAVAEPVK